MARKLVIVESPAKARTLNKILGNSYTVKASLGHVRDLPRTSLGVNIDENFAPEYVVPRKKSKIVREIKEAAKKASSVYLATDPDREGEAISWHILEAAKLNNSKVSLCRVVFHEITNHAVKEAFKDPRSIDMNLVNAQQARRILDRLVGYKLSPLLWRKVQRGLSAGRVQSVAVRMIVEREQEIQNFVPQEYWIIEVELAPATEERESSFKAKLVALINGRKLDISDKEEADKVIADLEKAKYDVRAIQTKQVARQPAPPFTTSTLQQEAWRKLHFTAAHTMAIAQQLYEGLPLGEEGSIGLITYMRTDSTRIAASAVAEAREFISQKYGNDFLPAKPRTFAKKVQWAQEAHGAIRPTQIYRQPEQIRAFLDRDQLRIYELVWKRMVASQMSSALYDTKNVEIQATLKSPKKGYLLKAASSAMVFPGFVAVYTESKDEDTEDEGLVSLPDLTVGDELSYLGVKPEQRFTRPSPRYTEATLIKALEENGIGRPSTYAPILSTIQERDYVHKSGGKFYPEELGIIVNNILVDHFPGIVDLGFTAQVEERLDGIARGEYDWVSILRDFYPPFEDMLQKASDNIKKVDMSKASDEICPNCSRPMVIKVGRFGKFLACSGYPECKTTMPFLVKTGIPCPECGGELLERANKKKQIFYGCRNYPQCQFATNYKPLPKACPQCSKLLVLAKNGWAKCLSCGHRVKIAEVEKQDERENAIVSQGG